MIHLRLAGGLGNQLFQLSAALAYQLPEEPIRLLTGDLNRYKTKREPDVLRLLDVAKLNAEASADADWTERLFMRWRLGRIMPGLGLSDRSFRPDAAAPARRWSLYLDGYFQDQWSAQGMLTILDRLRPMLRRPQVSAARPEVCVAHVRGGDFLQATQHQVIDQLFYARALDRLRTEALVTTVDVVTDDADYARQVLATAKKRHADISFTFPPNSGELLSDFAKILDASTRIIPNSTFSWWASALDDKQGLTMSPDRFLVDGRRPVALPWERLTTSRQREA